MTAFAPISGSILLYVARWLDPSLGFAYAGIAIPTELTAFASMVTFWDLDPLHIPIYLTAIIVALLVLNLFGVRSVSSFYWNNPGPMVSGMLHLIIHGTDPTRSPLRTVLEPGAMGRFLSLLVAITPAAVAVSGIELISITAAEAKQPRTNIIKAMKTVIFRLIIFFIFTVIVVGMVVPSNDPALLSPGTSAAQSPFVIAFQRAGVKVLPSVVNAILITVVLSAANTFIFSSSRILYGIAVQNKAPKVFATCTTNGLPWVAVIVAWLFSFLSFMVMSASSGTVFNWFIDLSAMCGFIGWITLNVTYLRYYYGLKKQGIVPRGIYRSPLQPYAAMWAIFWVFFYILFNGISVFWEWSTSQFIATYINLPIFCCLFIGYKLWYRTKMLPLSQLDFETNIPTLAETGDEGLLLEKPSLAKRLREII
ncbi:general amino acid permease [Chiua virens]|nr:general amino acid permease [Chiua virens]